MEITNSKQETCVTNWRCGLTRLRGPHYGNLGSSLTTSLCKNQDISPLCCFSFDCLLQVPQPNGSATINRSLSSTKKVGDHCVSVMISVIDSFEHLNSWDTLSEMRFECIIKRHLFLLILFHFLSLLCRFIIVSGALWMWMSALPYCLPLRNAPAPSANQPLHLRPLPSDLLPPFPLSNVVAQLWMWTLDTEKQNSVYVCVGVCVIQC